MRIEDCSRRENLFPTFQPEKERTETPWWGAEKTSQEKRQLKLLDGAQPPVKNESFFFLGEGLNNCQRPGSLFLSLCFSCSRSVHLSHFVRVFKLSCLGSVKVTDEKYCVESWGNVTLYYLDKRLKIGETYFQIFLEIHFWILPGLTTDSITPPW